MGAAADRIEPVMLTGRTCRVEPLGEGNLDAVYDALCVQSPPETWTYIMGGPYEDRDGFAGHVAGLHALPACVPLAIMAAEGRRRRTGARHRLLPADRPGQRLSGGRRDRDVGRTPAHDGGDGVDVPDDAPRLRGPRLPALRVEVRLPQRAVPPRGRPLRLPLRGPVPQRPGLQGPQPRHRLVLGHRRGVARPATGVRAPGWTRRTSTTGAVSAHRSRARPATADPGSHGGLRVRTVGRVRDLLDRVPARTEPYGACAHFSSYARDA